MANNQVENQAENGFTATPNILLEALYKSKLSGSEFQILLFIIRNTYGYHQKSKKLSASYISNGTNIPYETVRKGLTKLESKKIIKKIQSMGGANIISVEDIGKWFLQISQAKDITNPGKKQPGGRYKKNGQKLPHTQVKNGQTPRPNLTPNKRNIKETSKDRHNPKGLCLSEESKKSQSTEIDWDNLPDTYVEKE